jgi:hypothetical protein
VEAIGEIFGPRRRHRRALIVWLCAVMLLLVVPGTAIGGYRANAAPPKDSGLEMCERYQALLADATLETLTGPNGVLDLGDHAGGTPGRLTEDDYHALRERFENSAHDDVRESGVAFADSLWRAFGPVRPDPAVRTQLIAAYAMAFSRFTSACYHHGILIEI